jgi:hypothetical protein
MDWGRPRLGRLFSGAEPVPATDESEAHVLPEIVQDRQTDNHLLWLTVGIFVVVLAAGGGFWLGRVTVPTQLPVSADDSDDTDTSTPPSAPPTTAGATAPAAATTASLQSRRHYSHANEPQGAGVIAAAKPASGTVYVHRMNSDVRAQPSYDSEVVKKEAKGAQVQLIAVSDKWTEIEDGALKGWMRSSVLKDTPPGEKRSRKSDGGG